MGARSHACATALWYLLTLQSADWDRAPRCKRDGHATTHPDAHQLCL